MTDSDEESSSSENNWPMNEDWMMDMLKGDDESDAKPKINYFSAKSISQHGTSNLSDLISVTIKYEIGNDSSENQMDIVIKLLPQDPFGRYFVTINQFDLREIMFYTTIFTDLTNFQNANLKAGCDAISIAVPKCFFTKYKSGLLDDQADDNSSPDPSESILVLQDMRSLEFESVDLSNGLTLNEAESAIKVIAAIHSLTLGMKIKEKVDLNEKYPFLFQIAKATDSYQQLVEQGFPQLINFLKGVDGYSDELAALEAIRLQTKSIIEKLLDPIEPMGLITHTDFWCNNLLLKRPKQTDGASDKPIECVILDWQMITYSRPTNDLALLILSSLPSKIRRENTQQLLTIYYETMKENLSKMGIDLEVTLHYSKEKLFDDYNKSQLLALLLCIGSASIALGNRHAEQRFLDVLRDLYKENVLNIEDLSF